MVNVAILGFGTVGSGVAEVLTGHEDSISRKLNDFIKLKYILDVRDFPDSPFADRFVKDFSIIESDPEVDIVVAVSYTHLDVYKRQSPYSSTKSAMEVPS